LDISSIHRLPAFVLIQASAFRLVTRAKAKVALANEKRVCKSLDHDSLDDNLIPNLEIKVGDTLWMQTLGGDTLSWKRQEVLYLTPRTPADFFEHSAAKDTVCRWTAWKSTAEYNREFGRTHGCRVYSGALYDPNLKLGHVVWASRHRPEYASNRATCQQGHDLRAQCENRSLAAERRVSNRMIADSMMVIECSTLLALLSTSTVSFSSLRPADHSLPMKDSGLSAIFPYQGPPRILSIGTVAHASDASSI
jgi:hypothetical protein